MSSPMFTDPADAWFAHAADVTAAHMRRVRSIRTLAPVIGPNGCECVECSRDNVASAALALVDASLRLDETRNALALARTAHDNALAAYCAADAAAMSARVEARAAQ